MADSIAQRRSQPPSGGWLEVALWHDDQEAYADVGLCSFLVRRFISTTVTVAKTFILLSSLLDTDREITTKAKPCQITLGQGKRASASAVAGHSRKATHLSSRGGTT
ncbi:MAG TPA: hypothetical protein VM537_25845, partial [Anaerolineae bacterium]|nr:hypothetical protein [Anaerolineae bacterium]